MSEIVRVIRLWTEAQLIALAIDMGISVFLCPLFIFMTVCRKGILNSWSLYTERQWNEKHRRNEIMNTESSHEKIIKPGNLQITCVFILKKNKIPLAAKISRFSNYCHNLIDSKQWIARNTGERHLFQERQAKLEIFQNKWNERELLIIIIITIIILYYYQCAVFLDCPWMFVKKTRFSSLRSGNEVSTFSDLQPAPLASNIFFCFSNHERTAFFFLLHFCLPSIIQWRHIKGNFIAGYIQSNCLKFIEIFFTSWFLFLGNLTPFFFTMSFISVLSFFSSLQS